MGYYTYYNLNKISGPDEDFDKLVQDINDETGIDFSGDEVQEATWYDHEADLLRLSEKYPKLVIELEGDGENSDDVWAQRFSNGKEESTGTDWTSGYFKINDKKGRRKTLNDLVSRTRKLLVYYLTILAGEKPDKKRVFHGGNETLVLTVKESESPYELPALSIINKEQNKQYDVNTMPLDSLVDMIQKILDV